MQEGSIVSFLMALGVDYRDIVKTGAWVNCPCPMAPWTHAGGADTRPSFGVRVSNDELSYYYCFGCTPEGQRLDRLLHNMFVMGGLYPWQAAKMFLLTENHYYEDDEHRKPRKPDHFENLEIDEEAINPLPYEVLRKYELLQDSKDEVARRCIRWFEFERLIPEHIVNMFKVRYDPESLAVVFPLTDRKRNTFLLRSRAIAKKSIWTISPKVAGYPRLIFPKLRDVGVWFGMWLVDWRKPVIAVEAELDVLRLAALGVYNVIASATSSVSEAQIRTLMLSPNLILGYDSDRAGAHAHRRIKGRVGKDHKVKEIDWTIGRKHPKFRKDKDDLQCKDAGELESKEELRRVMRNIYKRA